ncbi:MAG: hypothetical protein REI78_10765 [Pedobacter sp.]|nr:hypothetical protein [Pedobacter sp.]
MEHLEQLFQVVELALEDKLTTNGGSAGTPSTITSFWNDASFFIGAVVHGVVTFSKEGGRNAGLCVR